MRYILLFSLLHPIHYIDSQAEPALAIGLSSHFYIYPIPSTDQTETQGWLQLREMFTSVRAVPLPTEVRPDKSLQTTVIHHSGY